MVQFHFLYALFIRPPPEGQLTSLTKCVVRTLLLRVYILLDVKKVHPHSHKLHRHSILSLYINSDALNEQWGSELYLQSWRFTLKDVNFTCTLTTADTLQQIYIYVLLLCVHSTSSHCNTNIAAISPSSMFSILLCYAHLLNFITIHQYFHIQHAYCTLHFTYFHCL